MSILDILNQYANPSATPPAEAEQHFDQVAQQTSRGDLGAGIAAAMRSDRTPALGSIVGSLFQRSNPEQQAGVLNHLIQSMGPGALGGVAGGVLGRILGSTSGAATTITPAQASQLSPSDVSAITAHAENHDPSIVDRLGSFYAEHPTLVKTLGAVALSAVMGHLRANH